MYGGCRGGFEDVFKVFDEMFKRNFVMLNVIIGVYVRVGWLLNFVELFL